MVAVRLEEPGCAHAREPLAVDTGCVAMRRRRAGGFPAPAPVGPVLRARLFPGARGTDRAGRGDIPECSAVVVWALPHGGARGSGHLPHATERVRGGSGRVGAAHDPGAAALDESARGLAARTPCTVPGHTGRYPAGEALARGSLVAL